MSHDSDDKFYNPLKRYQSYSYHHILVACDSTQTAGEIEKFGNITELQRERQQQGATTDSKYSAQTTKNGGRFVVLIDGLVDSDFFVDSVEWSTVIAPTETDQYSMMNTKGTLQIHEPFGVAFMERLVNLGSTLRTDMTGILFLLKTVFVGRRDDDPPPYSVTMLPHYRPFLFTMYNITSIITESGSQYEMSVFGASNGFAQQSHVSNMGKGMTVVVNTSDTVDVALQKTFAEMNRLYLVEAEKLGIVLAEGGAFAEGGEFRRVQYDIFAGDYGGDYMAGTNANTLTQDSNGQSILAFGEGATIEEIIDQVMKSSKEVMADSAIEGQKYIHKITSMLNSTPSTMVIEYQVNKFKFMTTPYLAIQDKTPDSIPEDQIRTYNYIFTGQNTDILELDIKMNMGMSFFHTASSSTHPLSHADILTGKASTSTVGSTDVGSPSEDGKPRPITPLFLGDKITDPAVRNVAEPVTTALYHSMLERHAFLESTAVTMKIAGDPLLMSEILVTSEPLTADDAGYERERTYLASPMIFKVNIQYPIDGILRPFWYRGLYTLQQVDNIFSGGSFTQVLRMYSLPTVTELSNTVDAADGDTLKNQTWSDGKGAAVAEDGKTKDAQSSKETIDQINGQG